VSRPADVIHQLPANQPDRKGVAEDSEDRLVKRLRVSKKMRPFVRRMRMRLSELDHGDPATVSQFERSCEKMASILAKKKILEAKAKRAIAETLEAAVDHQLQGLRQKDGQRDRVRSAGDVGRLIARLEELAEAIVKLPPVSKKKLNAIVAEYAAQFFDTETFSALIYALADALPELEPKRRAQDVLKAVYQPVAGIVRTSPPELIELWESLCAETRRQVEREVRALATKKSAVEFFRKLIVLLNKFLPRAIRGRLQTIQSHYIHRVGEIWAKLELKVGQAYDGFQGKNVESSFQRFARLALAAVGDGSVISRRQITKQKGNAVPAKSKK
jgi:hypothetical protein